MSARCLQFAAISAKEGLKMTRTPTAQRRMGTVKPCGKKIQELRMAKGWTGSDLAERAQLSPRTISNVEADKNVFLTTLRCIADALQCKVSDLLTYDATWEPAADRAVRTITVRVVINTDISSSDEKGMCMLTEMLAQLAKLQDHVVIEDVTEGSVVIHLSLTEDDVNRLIQAFNEGVFNEMNKIDAIWMRVIGITLPPSFKTRNSSNPAEEDQKPMKKDQSPRTDDSEAGTESDIDLTKRKQ
jgi:transcriptional regulator with XRE-family HTH domain